MSLTKEEYVKLKDENINLKQMNLKLKRRIKSSIMQTDFEFLLNSLIPKGSELNYEVFVELYKPLIKDYLELLKVVTLLLKVNREDLAYIYLNNHSFSINSSEFTQQDIQMEYNRLIKQLLSKSNIQALHLKILFEIISIEKKQLFPIYKGIFNQYFDQLLMASFTPQNDDWLLKLLYYVRVIDKEILVKFFEYLNNHWDLIYRWISQNQLPIWESIVKIAGHRNFEKKIEVLKEYYQLKKDGLIIDETNYTPCLKDKNNPEKNGFTEQWKEVSDLRKYGYEVTDKSNIERWIAIHKAMRHIPVTKIVSHIQLLLNNSYRRHRINGDFSNSINAYETDLDYLENIFK